MPAIIAIAIVYVGDAHLVRGLRAAPLVLSPEEEYAVSGGLHGDPQAEGYGGEIEEELLATDGVDEPTRADEPIN